nr:hypothetical protein [Acanthopleuribacter pedis]
MFGAFFYWGYIKLSIMLLTFIFQQPVYGLLLASRLLQILLVISLGVGLMSSLTNAIAHFYMSRDLEFQFGLPVNFNSWAIYRFSQVYMQSNWMLLLFGGPFIWIYLDLAGAPWWAPPFGVLILAMLASFPTLFSAILCMLLVKVFPAKRVHQVFLVLTIVLVAGVIFLFRYLEPEQFIGPGGLDRFRGFSDVINLDAYQWNPATWAANILAAVSGRVWGPGLEYSLYLTGAFSGACLLFMGVAHRVYRRSWDRALQSLSGEGDIQMRHADDTFLSRALTRPAWAQEAREILLFLRDPSQWSQIFVLLSLLGLYLFSVTKLPKNPFGGSLYELALGNSGFIAFISLSLVSRFVFTSFSNDGQAIWLMKTAPDGWGRYVRGKFLVFGIPSLGFSLALNLLSGVLMDLGNWELFVLGLGVFWDTLFMIGLGLGLGMLFIDPGVDNPLKMIVSTGGFLLMAAGLFVTFIHVLLRLSFESPLVNELLMHLYWPDVQGSKIIPYAVGLGLFELGTVVFLVRRGLEHLRRGDF